MKVYQLASALVISLFFLSSSSCKKEVDSQNPPSTSSTSTLPVVFTSNVNFSDEGLSIAMNGVSNYTYSSSQTPATSGDITSDSILRLYFEDKATNTDFSLILNEKGGDLIQPGTYTLAAATSEYGLAIQLKHTQSDFLYLYSNAYNGFGFQYNGQAIISNGTLIISSVSQTSISGTISAELYYSSTGVVTNKTHKAIITNGSFNCDIIRY